MMIEMYIFKGINLLLALGTIFMMTVFPIILLWYLLLQPTLEIRKEMKNGKTFKQAWKEVFKEDGSYNPTISHLNSTSSSQYTGTSITDYANNPLYSSMPGNIYHRH